MRLQRNRNGDRVQLPIHARGAGSDRGRRSSLRFLNAASPVADFPLRQIERPGSVDAADAGAAELLRKQQHRFSVKQRRKNV